MSERVTRAGRAARTLALLVALVTTGALSAATATFDEVDTLRAGLERVLADAGWPSARWGVLAVSLDTGDTLFARLPDEPLAPASNLKLATTAAALHHLGPDFRYETLLLGEGPVRENTLVGDLILYGTGDPGLSDRFYDSSTAVLESLADQLVEAGVVRVEGDVVGDGTFFQGPLYGEGWDPGDLDDWYAAPASALSFAENTVTLRIEPAATNGARPTVHTLPPDAEVPVVNGAVTGRGRIRIHREHPTRPIVIDGAVPRGGRDVWRRMTVGDPNRFAAGLLLNALRERGVRVEGTVRSVTDPARSRVTGRRLFAPGLGRTAPRILARHTSPPLREYLEVVNKESHNLFSELILKTVGRIADGRGSYAGGARAVEAFLADEVGADTARIELYDGSGLSELNRLAPSDLVRLMAYMAASGNWETFWSTLPEAGNPRELRRMYRTAAAGNLRAKTGTIENVSALTGLVRSANGERIAFSILGNDLPSTWGAKRVEDRIGERLARFRRPFEARSDVRLAGSADPAVNEPEERLARAGGGSRGAELRTPRSRAEDGASEKRRDPRRHLVQAGENFTVIARRYGVSLDELIGANPDVSPRELRAGQWIEIPGPMSGPPR